MHAAPAVRGSHAGAARSRTSAAHELRYDVLSKSESTPMPQRPVPQPVRKRLNADTQGIDAASTNDHHAVRCAPNFEW